MMDENKITYYPTLCEVSIRAAITQIENIIYYSSNKDLDNPSNPYEKQLIEYLNSFDLELDPFLKLKKLTYTFTIPNYGKTWKKLTP